MATANAFDQFDAAGNPFDAFDQRRKDAPESPVAASDSLTGRIKAALQTPSPGWLQPFETAVKHNVEPFIEHPVDSVYKMVVPQKEDIEAIKQVLTDPKKAFSRDTPIGSQQWWDQVVGYGAPLVLGAAGKGFSPKTAGIREVLAPSEEVPHGIPATKMEVPKDLQSETARISPETPPPAETIPEFARKPLEQPARTTPETSQTARSAIMPENAPDFADSPLVSFIKNDVGGILSRTAAQKKWGADKYAQNQSLWDDAPQLRSPRHNLIYDPNGVAPDEAATAAAEAGLLPDGADATTLWQALQHESDSAHSLSAQVAEQRATEKTGLSQYKAFSAAIEKPIPGEKPITGAQLNVGDTVRIGTEEMKVTDIDPDTYDVTVEDGSKFGIQHVKDGQAIYGEIAARGAKAASANDFRPALKTGDTVLEGEQGQTHEDIYQAQPDPVELRASEPEHGFVDPEGNFKTREEVSQALGEPDPMQSERLRELQQSAEPMTTGIANRVLKAEAEAGKIGEVESGEGISWQDSVQRGRALLNGGADPQMVARRVQRSGRISADDMAVLRAERERMNLETNRAEDAFRRAPNDVTRKAWQDARAAETKFVREAVQPAKTEWHKLGMATQGEAPIDYSTFAGLRKAAVDEKLRDVTLPEEKALQRAAKNVREATGKEVEASQRLARQAERQFRGQKIKTVEQLKAEASKMMQELMPCK